MDVIGVLSEYVDSTGKVTYSIINCGIPMKTFFSQKRLQQWLDDNNYEIKYGYIVKRNKNARE